MEQSTCWYYWLQRSLSLRFRSPWWAITSLLQYFVCFHIFYVYWVFSRGQLSVQFSACCRTCNCTVCVFDVAYLQIDEYTHIMSVRSDFFTPHIIQNNDWLNCHCPIITSLSSRLSCIWPINTADDINDKADNHSHRRRNMSHWSSQVGWPPWYFCYLGRLTFWTHAASSALVLLTSNPLLKNVCVELCNCINTCFTTCIVRENP